MRSPNLAGRAPRHGDGAARRVLEGRVREAVDDLDRVGRRGAVLRLDRRRPAAPDDKSYTIWFTRQADGARGADRLRRPAGPAGPPSTPTSKAGTPSWSSLRTRRRGYGGGHGAWEHFGAQPASYRRAVVDPPRNGPAASLQSVPGARGRRRRGRHRRWPPPGHPNDLVNPRGYFRRPPAPEKGPHAHPRHDALFTMQIHSPRAPHRQSPARGHIGSLPVTIHEEQAVTCRHSHPALPGMSASIPAPCARIGSVRSTTADRRPR
jgi:hypothetical protein